MYDMYRWDQPDGAAVDGRRPARAERPGGDERERAARGVQEALDRRDNGGDAAAPRGQ